MYGRQNPLASYGRVANSENDPLQQIVLLYDGAIKFLRLTATDIDNRDIPAKAEHVNRALDILNYLQGILDFERGGDVARQLDELYASISMKVLRASAHLDAAEMRKAADLLGPVRDSWATVAAAAAEPVPAVVMQSGQTPRLGNLVMA